MGSNRHQSRSITSTKRVRETIKIEEAKLSDFKEEPEQSRIQFDV